MIKTQLAVKQTTKVNTYFSISQFFLSPNADTI